MATYTLDRFPPPTVPPAAPSTPTRGLAAGSGASGGGDGRGGNARVNPAAQQPERIVGSSRAEQFPQIWGPVGPGTGSLHASPRLCVYIQLFRTRICARMVEWRRGAPSLVPRRRRRRGPFRAHLHALSRMGGGGGKVSRVCCRSVVASASLLLLFYPCATPVAPGPSCQKRVQGSQDQGEKRSGEHTP